MDEKRTSNFCLTNAIVDIASQENAHDPSFISTVFGNENDSANMLNQFICGLCWNHVKQQYNIDTPVPKISGLNRNNIGSYLVIYARFADEFITQVDDTVFFIFAIKDNQIRYFTFTMDTVEAYTLTEIRLYNKAIQTAVICENETMGILNQCLVNILAEDGEKI